MRERGADGGYVRARGRWWAGEGEGEMVGRRVRTIACKDQKVVARPEAARHHVRLRADDVSANIVARLVHAVAEGARALEVCGAVGRGDAAQKVVDLPY